MWASSSAGNQGKRKKRASTGALAEEEKAADAVMAAFHSRANIRHKDQLALFVPATFIALLGTDGGIFKETQYHVASSKLSGRHG